MLMLEIDPGGDQAADLILDILKTVGVPERSNGQTRGGMGVEYDALPLLHTGALHKALISSVSLTTSVNFVSILNFSAPPSCSFLLTLRSRSGFMDRGCVLSKLPMGAESTAVRLTGKALI